MFDLRPLVVSLFFLATGQAEEPPNFLVILVDDLGFSDLGCYGGEIATPQLDALAANGLRYTHFSNTGRCWPTRAALLSGYYPHQIRRDKVPGHQAGGGHKNRRPSWARLLPDFLAPAGYRCYHSGKWHIDGPILAAGFHRSWWVNNQGDFFSHKGNSLDDVKVTGPVPKGYYSTIATADHAIECLQDHAEHHDGSPFFHYLAFIAPHFPLHALPEDIALYRDRYLEGWDRLQRERFAKQQSMNLLPHAFLSPFEPQQGPPYDFPDAFETLGPGEVQFPAPWDTLTEEQKRFQATKMAIHAAMIDRMDREIGRVVEQLKAMDAFENTVIFFASDNGASAEIMVRHGGHDPSAPLGSAATYLCLGPGFSTACNTPFRKHKTWVHEGGTATPLIVHWPQGISAQGELRRTVSHVIDLAPTILELAQVPAPTEWEGTPLPPKPGLSLVPTLEGDVALPRDYLWWYHEDHRAVRQGEWKLVATANGPWELYQISQDRAETKNLAEAHPEKVTQLEALWQSHLDETIEILEAHPIKS